MLLCFGADLVVCDVSAALDAELCGLRFALLVVAESCLGGVVEVVDEFGGDCAWLVEWLS